MPVFNSPRGVWEKNPDNVREGVHYHKVTPWCHLVVPGGDYVGHTFGYIARVKLQYCLALALQPIETVRKNNPEMLLFRQYIRSVHYRRLKCVFVDMLLRDIPDIHETEKLSQLMVSIVPKLALSKGKDLSLCPRSRMPPLPCATQPTMAPPARTLTCNSQAIVMSPARVTDIPPVGVSLQGKSTPGLGLAETTVVERIENPGELNVPPALPSDTAEVNTPSCEARARLSVARLPVPPQRSPTHRLHMSPTAVAESKKKSFIQGRKSSQLCREDPFADTPDRDWNFMCNLADIYQQTTAVDKVRSVRTASCMGNRVAT